MLDGSVGEQLALSLQVCDNDLVGLLDVLTSVVRNFGSKLAILVNRNWGLTRLDDSGGHTGGVIVLTKAGSTVDNTSTCVFGDEVTGKDLEAAISAPLLEEGEEGLVALANDGLTLELLKDFVRLDLTLLADVIETCLHADVDFLSSVVLEFAVVHLGVHTEGQVGGQGPGSGRPSNEVCWVG